MAPELFLKGKTYNPSKVDMWALGVMIYYLLEGIFNLIQANIHLEATTRKI